MSERRGSAPCAGHPGCPRKVRRHRRSARGESGLTLLELLLVVVLISAVAFVSLAQVRDEAAAVRAQDTRARLEALRAAVLGASGARRSPPLLGGYVVDNGALPQAIEALTAAPAGFAPHDLAAPILDPQPDGGDFSDGPPPGSGLAGEEIALDAPAESLLKGHHGGYVAGVRGGQFRDGWGRDLGAGGGASGIDCPFSPAGSSGAGSDLQDANHGWCLTLFDGQWHVASYGLDAAPGTRNGLPLEADVALEPPVLAGDWQVTLPGGSTVEVVNATGTDIDLDQDPPWSGADPKLRVSLLAFRNGAGGGRWRRVTGAATLDRCLDGDGDGQCAGAPAPAGTTAAFAGAFSVPIGEHLLVLVFDPDGVRHSADDTPALPVGAGRATTRLRLWPRALSGDMRIEIR